MVRREEAYLFDLFLAPGWQELFNRMIEEEVKLPKEGYFLELECGSGGFAIDLAGRGGEKVNLLSVDSDPELVAIATEKARIRKSANVRFATAETARLAPELFDLVIVDLSLVPWRSPSLTIHQIAPLIRPGGQLVAKFITTGSFDEVFSVYWEALYDLGLTEYSPQLEKLIAERLTISEAEHLAINAGFRHVHSVVRKEIFNFTAATDFFDSPLIRLPFLAQWLGILPNDAVRDRVRTQIASIIDRERNGRDFDTSIKATLITGRK